MATTAHCYYCFESLAASYQRRKPIDLASVEELWECHEQFKRLSVLQDNEETESLSVDDDEEPTGNGRPQKIKLPGVNRLQSDSTSTTTPSSLNSSHSTLTTSTTLTTPGSSSLSDTASGRSRREPEKQEYPLFVTWNTISRHGHKSLRGCIGTFEAQELSEGLRDYALTSAFEDTRFAPIPSTLLPSLSCSLTLLGTFEPCTNALDWILGLHGLRISFIHRGRRYGATYLPDVAVEQGWTKEETVKSLMQKAGWDESSSNSGGSSSGSAARRFLRGGGGSTSSDGTSVRLPPWELVSDFRAVKYQGLKASCTYAEWQEWRRWVLSLGDGSEKLLVG
ncbi:AMMECR1 domain-containing protein [Aspergillus homomorphus CBS 101889]|uniref:AMMECR1 domain-containing protein n=1 Tax=Aspergillus homomorphus (strain CBS 101889) TaxID=1450537 RepID=A0A395HTH6_ASPHC|nr:hypothetical protein BO97DRAFT_393357 [Aspergillus homomorphus CBS 101889]RAL10856.1 hypothetical protein BO97DRAFT_393357 [Aspergillus homomorphus CBS 101889]